MLEFISSVWWMLVTLGVLVTFHEYGHFWVARKFGVEVIKFSVGYGNFFWSKKDRYGTEFGLAPIPLGGFVKLLDDRDLDVVITSENKNKTFNSKPIWQRTLILFAGPLFNFVLAAVMFFFMFVYGKNEITPVLGEPTQLMAEAGAREKDQLVEINGYEIKTWQDVSLELITSGLDRENINFVVLDESGLKRHLTLSLSKLPDSTKEDEIFKEIGLKPWQIPISNIIDDVEKGYPAELAGVQAGDQILSINNNETNDWYGVVDEINQNIDKPLNLKILRNNNVLDVSIGSTVKKGDRRLIGISQQSPIQEDLDFYNSLIFRHSYGVFSAVPEAFKETYRMIEVSLEMMGKIITGKASLQNLSGPITIAQVANDSAARGIAWFLGFLGLVSLSLGIINLLPVPMLDGGQILFLVFEKIKGAPLSTEFQMRGQLVGMFFLLCVMSIAFYNDILRLVS